MVKLGTGGSVCVYTSAPVELIVDVVGWTGRSAPWVSINPARVTDTRRLPGGTPTVAAGSIVRVPVSAASEVDAAATAAAINVTAVDAQAAGFLTVFPCGTAVPVASNVNFQAATATANAVITGLVSGEVCIYTSATVNIIVDVMGWTSTSGAVTGVVPQRVADTRQGQGGTRLPAGTSRAVNVGRPSTAGAVAALNVTAADSKAGSFLTVHACNGARPNTSNVNVTASGTSSGLVLIAPDAAGNVCVYSYEATDLVVDLNGWMNPSSGYRPVTPKRLVDTRPPLPSPTPTPTPPPATGTAGAPSFGGCAVFPSTYAFNSPIASLPARPESAAVIAKTNQTGNSSKLQFAFWSNPASGMHPIVVPASQPLVPITYDQYPQESDPGPFPIPLNAPQEDNGDKHIIVVQQGTCQLYELWATHRSTNGWYAGTGAKWDLNTSSTRPPRWTSADAAGLPILPGLLRYEEVASGRIDHALRMIVGVGRRAVVAPATHFVGSDDPLLLPMGARLRLRSDFDTSRFTGQSKVIVEALKTYGLIVADNGPNWMISGVGDSRWDDANMDQIRNISASDLVYVDNGPVVLP